MDPPAGVVLAENQHYNPYFPGGAIGMAQALYDEVIIFNLHILPKINVVYLIGTLFMLLVEEHINFVINV